MMAGLDTRAYGGTARYNPADDPNFQGWGQPPRTQGLPALGGSAQDTFANLTRQSWQDYMTQFMPLENLLIDYASDPLEVSKAMGRASSSVGTQFDAQQGMTGRGLRGRQITLRPEEKAAADRESSLSRSLADVQAQNIAGQQTLSRQRGILGQPMPSVDVPAGLGK